jgi:ribosomal protein L37E
LENATDEARQSRRRAKHWYLTAYSPDLNPIEQAFAKVKHWMRAAQKRTIDDTCRHIGGLLAAIGPNATTTSPTPDSLLSTTAALPKHAAFWPPTPRSEAVLTSNGCVRAERGVTVECLKCGHVGFLSPKALSRAAVALGTPIAAIVKRLRCRRCGSQSVLATRKPSPQKGFMRPTPLSKRVNSSKADEAIRR